MILYSFERPFTSLCLEPGVNWVTLNTSKKKSTPEIQPDASLGPRTTETEAANAKSATTLVFAMSYVRYDLREA